MEQTTFKDRRILEPDLQIIRQVHNDIVNTWQRPLPNVSLLAQQSGMSLSKFRTLFRHIYGQSIYQYHLHVRLNHAKRLIATKEFTITQIAYKVGFDHHQNFIKAFKKQECITPLEFANKNKE